MSQDPLKEALEELLRQFDIKIDSTSESASSEKTERKGDYSELISKTQDKLDELSVKAEEMLQQSGLSREELENYCNTRSNFSEEQWQALENFRKSNAEFRENTRLTLGEEVMKKAENVPEKKQTSRFGKKKHWIPL